MSAGLSASARRGVGILPAAGLDEHRTLLSALEEAFPVHFEAGSGLPDKRLDALIALDASILEQPPRDLRCLVLGDGRLKEGFSEPIDFASEGGVPQPLRGQRMLAEALAGQPLLTPKPSDRVLATARRGPAWWEHGSADRPTQTSVFPLPHLAPGQTLREHLRLGRFMGLAPLLHLLRSVTAEIMVEPPLRACFVIDDPNLHWPSYGHLDYRRMAEHARRGGYHVALATIPLDGWMVHPRAAALLRANRSTVSLAMHGNDHLTHELGRLVDDEDAEKALAQAVRRVRTLERRSGVPVDRVMVPPHERCSEQALRAMLRLGFDGACITRPHPWRDGKPAASPLLGWRPAELVAGGVPVLPRHSLRQPLEDLVFRSLLGQPLILYGHQADLADGPEVLDRAADFVNRLGAVQWGSLAWIARTNFTLSQAGDTLLVGLHTRRATIDVPPGVSQLRAGTAEVFGGAEWNGLSSGDQAAAMRPVDGGWISDPLAVHGPGRLELALTSASPLREDDVGPPTRRTWPLVRRVLAEARDRVSAHRKARDAAGLRRVVMLLENNPYPQDTRVRNEAEALVADGRRVTVIAPRERDQPVTEEVTGVFVRRYRCPSASGSLLSYVAEYGVAHIQLLARGSTEVLRGADVVHFHGPPDTLAIFGAVARLAGRKTIFDLHDSAPELFAAKFGSSRLHRILLRAQRGAILCATRVIVTNDSQRELVRSRTGRNGTRVSVVRNGPREAEFGEPPPGRPGLLRDPQLIYVGALDVQDGVLELVDLLKTPGLSLAHLTVVGDGPLAKELGARCQAAGLDQRVTFMGRVPHDRIPGLIASADIGIDPAPGTELNHGSTMIKVAEYLAVGRPVVAYALRETQRTAADAALYAPCGDRGAFAELIADLAGDPARRVALGLRARERSAELMWERSAAVLRELYADLD